MPRSSRPAAPAETVLWTRRVSVRGPAGDVIDRDRLAQALQGEVADLLERNGPFDRRGDPLAEEYLAVPRFSAEPCGEVADGADRGVVDTLLEADPPKSGVTLCDADAK